MSNTGVPCERASVLVVDDNPLITGVMRKLLAPDEFEVLTCNGGQEALNLLGRRPVDVIVCDIMMPQMDGYNFQKHVRSREDLAHIPFVFLTALGESDDQQIGNESGADNYIVKPFEPEQLISVVRGKVRRSRYVKDAAESANEGYRKKVIHTLSHEFRTPLVAINTGAEILTEQRDRLDEKRMKDLLEAIKRGGERLERLVNDFMCMQQLDAGIAAKLIESRAVSTSVSEIVRESMDRARDQFERALFEETNYAKDSRVKVYSPYIVDSLRRIIENGVKFSRADLTIGIYSYTHDGEVVIEVRDRGIGFDVQKVTQAMTAFGQIDRDQLEQQGGGLGLTIANRYAIAHGGRLDFSSKPGAGSVVSLILPSVRS